ncbi:MAG TPA: enoyl-CoA hydratase-related protein, partial [Candidatus Limnocylindrales bacterium]|nr:enoyl-CoA hydratase-related protein [Candidatus Limnocylindrales bacterium]
MPEEPTVLVDVDAEAGIAIVTLNRPEALNSLTVPMKQELLAAFRRLERESGVRAVVLSGAGRAFCAGQDLRERLQPDAAPLGVELRERYNPIIRAMRALPKP